jgi:signal transduction histidine kinase
LSKASLLHSVVGRVVAVTALGAIAIGGTLALFFAANSSLKHANQENARATAINTAAVNLRVHVLELATTFEAVVGGNGKQAVQQWKTAEQSWRQPAASLAQAAAPSQGLEAESLAVRAQIESFLTDFAEPVIAIAKISPALARSSTSQTERTIRIDEILKATDTMSTVAASEAAQSSASANRLAHRAQVAGLAALIFAPLLLVGLAIWLAKSVAAPLRRTVNAASEVAAGHFDVRLDDRRRDEFGELGHAFNAMTKSLAVSRDELVERAESLEQAERHKSELISMVSHEVRTPLASILGFTRLLLEREVDEDARRRYLEIIDAEATRLASLVSDFLDARLIEEGQFALRPELFDARALVLEQAELALVHDEAHDLELQLHDTPLLVQADRLRLTQVVANVLSNAIKYSPAGGTIVVGAAPSATGARIWVDDEGTGIAPEHRAQIFEPFFRGGAPEAGIPGTGLGLAVSRRIVNAHGGTMGFDALPGGTRFWIELPLEQPVAEIDSVRPRQAPTGVPSP